MKVWHIGLILFLTVVVLAGCGGGQATPAGEGSSAAYTSGVWDTSYTGALDVGGQLVLGTIRLEETGNGVTPEQATALLPLWQALQGNVTAQAEVNAVLKKIEETMTSEQLATIATMRLTLDDLRAWMQSQGLDVEGGPGPGPGGGGDGQRMPPDAPPPPSEFAGGEMPPEMATRQAEFESMSEEEREALRATHEAGGPGGPSAQAERPTALMDSLIELLTQRAAESADQSAVTSTSHSTSTPRPASTPLPTSTPTASLTVTETVTPTSVPAEASAPLPAQPTPVSVSATTGVPSLEITQLEDTSPGPPFTILVSTVRAEDDVYKVTGIVRNDGSETYEGLGVIGTFYTRGPSGQGSSDEDMFPHGPVDAHCSCPFLDPGAECPFSLEIYARNYVAYGLHPNGQPVEYSQPAAIVLSDVTLSNDGVGNVRITGTASNENVFTVESATIVGSLLDADGQVMSAGSTLVLGTIAPGASVAFDLRIEYQPYSHYQLYAQATQN
jgi:hypothetical protein